jgi:hypothetical protein
MELLTDTLYYQNFGFSRYLYRSGSALVGVRLYILIGLDEIVNNMLSSCVLSVCILKSSRIWQVKPIRVPGCEGFVLAYIGSRVMIDCHPCVTGGVISYWVYLVVCFPSPLLGSQRVRLNQHG